MVILDRKTIATTAAPAADDALRQVAGFTLFRRTDSRAANPTSQGVSLRGIGASGASRALVLDDGVPLNDAFGGWIYWGRVPRAAIDRIEVVRGGASDLYGSAAMGGVVQFVRRDDGAIAAEATGGSSRSGAESLFAASSRGAWRGSVAADLLTTNGYVLVDPSQRGAVDRAADVRHTSIDATLERTFGDAARLFVRGSHYAEERNNGTALQVNDTQMKQLALGADLPANVSLRAYGSEQRYHQTFSAISADRSTERLTTDQRVPSRARGASAQVVRALGDRNALVAGAEERGVDGTDDEISGTKETTVFGRQRAVAAFAEDSLVVTPSLTATAALRFDGWRNFDAHRDGAKLASRSDDAWSPRMALLWRASDRVSVTAAAYRAFRAPTLNELYRNFRVGNVVTLANESLGAERLSAVETGARFDFGRASLRATLFSMTTDETIANVTLATTSALITRQRQNLGSSRSRGAELDADWRAADDWRVSAGWLFADATLSTGRRTPQVPRNTATLQATWRASVSAQLRWSSTQFDDDLNQFPLRSYVAVDLFASHPLMPHVDGLIAIENVTNARIEASATPVVTLGQPRAFRAGLRYRR